jgi:hypothetical protein
LDKISREGLENANVDCFLSVRRALCLTHYRKCIPEEDGRFVPVCESVRTQTLEVCSQGGVFADWSVIEDHLDDDAFATSEDCVAVAAGANVADAKPEHEMVGNASITTSPIPTPTATATPTDTQRTCTLDDMEPHYERYCETNGTMIMSMRRKSSVVCEDSDHFEQQMRTLQCACPKDRLRTFVSLCGPSGERTVIPYQPDATGQLCDRRLEVPEPHNETCIAAFTHTWADSQIRHNFTGLTWGLRTGCAPSKCFDGQDIWSRQDDATCRIPQENCPEWELSAEKAQSPSLSSNLTSFLEMAVASLDTAIRPAVIFIFSAISAMPVNSGLVVKLDDEERMALTGDQATPVGYEILLKPGQRHHLRWEWHGDNHTQTHAILHSFIMMESFIEINMHPLPGHATNVGTSVPTSQATEQATPTSDVSDKVTSTASASITFAELPNVTPVVTLNSTQITANINHQPARHPSDSATTAQKEQNPFEVATTDNDDDTTIDQVAVSRRSSGGVFVTIIFICLGIGLSGLFLWQRHTGRPNDHALGRWLKRRYAQVPHHPLLGGRRDTNSANKLSHDTSLEMQHFKVSNTKQSQIYTYTLIDKWYR